MFSVCTVVLPARSLCSRGLGDPGVDQVYTMCATVVLQSLSYTYTYYNQFISPTTYIIIIYGHIYTLYTHLMRAQTDDHVNVRQRDTALGGVGGDHNLHLIRPCREKGLHKHIYIKCIAYKKHSVYVSYTI